MKDVVCMNENIKILLQKLAEDKDLQEQFKEINDPYKAYELAATVQGGFSKDEFITTMKEIRAKMSRDLSDEDLEKAAGGGDTTLTPGTVITTATIPAAASVCVAAL